MGQVYIKFKTVDIKSNSGQRIQGWLTRTAENSFTTILMTIIPKANPAFDGKIGEVKEWILEVDDEEGTPIREIGLDERGVPVMIMPWKDNYGFWTDSPVKVDQLAKSTEMIFSDKEEFERHWNEFDTRNRTH